METIKKLKKWLDKPGNSKAVLASRMGYLSTEAIRLWIAKGWVPAHKEAQVLEIITKKKESKENGN